jgi:outer membrane immunogenic protein
MKKLLLAIATLVSSAGGSAFAADWPVPLAPPVGAVFIPPFTWSSCYIGLNIGGGWGQKDITDPADLVQHLLLGLPAAPVTPVALGPNGYLVGAQFGCDYQPAGSNWVIGFEGAASGANIRNETFVALPLGDPGDQALVNARLDFIPSGTVRLGYAWDRFLLYVKGGAAGASDKYSVSGVFTAVTNPTPFNFQGLDLRVGWTAGAGFEFALWEDWSVKVEYDYYGFGHNTVLMSDSNLALSAPIDVKQTIQTVKLGLNFHMWSYK